MNTANFIKRNFTGNAATALLEIELHPRDDSTAASFVKSRWDVYNKVCTPNKNLNGSVFEGILVLLLTSRGVRPIFTQVKLTYVPNIEFDIVLYDAETGPVILSAKTSLRERYKQAALEGYMLKQVHYRAESHLITLDDREAKNIRAKLDGHSILGLNSVFCPSAADDFNAFFDAIAQRSFIKPPDINPIQSSREIIKFN